MSSILEALRKLDRERAERKGGVVNIEQEILKSSSQGVASRRRYLALLIALACSVIILCFLVVFVWWRPFSAVDTSKTTAIRRKVPVPVFSKTGRLPMPPSDRPPSGDKKEPVSASLQGDAAPAPFRAVEEPPVQSRPLQSPSTPTREAPADIPFKPAPAVKPAPVVKPSKPVPPPKRQQQAVTRPLPRLSVAGIAFRQDRSSRLAIINGQPVGIGEVIEGVKVVDILEDQIRFSFQGRKFSLGVGDSTRD